MDLSKEFAEENTRVSNPPSRREKVGGATPTKPEDLEERLRTIERKLDMILLILRRKESVITK